MDNSESLMSYIKKVYLFNDRGLPSIKIRNDLNNIKKRLKALEGKIAHHGLELFESIEGIENTVTKAKEQETYGVYKHIKKTM